jgi:hypothetical protein
LEADEGRAVVPDLADAGPGEEQMHEEVFRFDRIVGEVRGDSVIVLRMNRVIDGVFFEHGVVPRREDWVDRAK